MTGREGVKEIFGLEGEPALVVGGGYGSGRLTAMLLQQAGARVAIADIDPARAKAVSEELGVPAFIGDIREQEQAVRVVDEAHEALGGLKRVANIVGLVKMGPFAEMSLADWDDQFRLNLHSQMFIAQAAGRHMLADGVGRNGGGAIAMVASVSGYYGARNQAAYGAAKAGVMSLARSLADEWGPSGIRVNCVAPDITAVPRLTDQMGMPLDRGLAQMDALAVSEGVPLQRFGRAEEIAKVLLFLVSDMSSFMTGQTLVNDGGVMVHFPHQTGSQRR